MENKFKVDFFEFCCLVEACIPPRPIARAYFWDKVLDEHYHQMTKIERKKLFEWIQLSPNFNLKQKDCKRFHARFNPDNQYLVRAKNNGTEKTFKTYLFDDRYHTKKSTFIVKETIIDITKRT